MASFVVDLEDSSPLISYAPAGAWTEDPAGDPLISSYSAGSMHTTNMLGATATLNFNGTGISMYGGLRPNYGTYVISVDGHVIANASATSSTPVFKQLLATVSGLNNGPHTAVLTNGGSGPVDIDFLQFDNQIGSTGAQVTNTTIDDSDPRIQYRPSDSAWQTTNNSMYIDNTLHFTQTPGSQASLSFSGEAVAVYGTVSPTHSDIQITVDGNTITVPGGSGGFVSALRPQTLLYYANNLGSEQQHNISIAAAAQQSAGAGPWMDLDAVVVYSSSSSFNESSPTGKSTANDNVKHQTRPHLSTIVAASVAGAIVSLIILALLLLLLRRRRKVNAGPRTPLTPNLPIQNPKSMEAGYWRSSNIPSHKSERSKAESPSNLRLSMDSVTSTTPILTLPPRSFPPPPAARRNDSLRPARPGRPPTLVLPNPISL